MSDNVASPSMFQETEVSAIEWLTYNEAVEKIRPYNVEKIEILERVDKLLREYRIYV